MKFIRILFFAALALVAHSAQAETIHAKVNGMVCAFCAQGIEKKLRAQAATQDVYISLQNKIVALSLKEGQSLSDETVKEVITDAGYSITAIERSQASLDSIRQAAGKK
jgi:copper chaperone CopZ